MNPAYQNYCVQCLPETLPEEIVVTYVIPLDPVAAARPAPTNMTGSGVAYNGVRLDGPAPLDAILGEYTISPFDDCGGHVNPFGGYHYHAVTDYLDDAANAEDQGTPIGIVVVGYVILLRLIAIDTASANLDQCSGHADTDGSYHYHVREAGSNAILGYMTAQTGCTLNDPDGACDASARRPRP